MVISPDIAYPFLFIDIITNKLEINPFLDPLVNGYLVVLADRVNGVNGGSVAGCGIYMVEPGVDLINIQKIVANDCLYSEFI